VTAPARGSLVYGGRRVLLKHHRLLDGVHDHPPNSVAALRRLLAERAEAIECDLRLTRDDAFVLLHDPTLDRETTGSGPVRRVTSREMAMLRLRGGDEPPATLADVVGALAAHPHPLKVQFDLVEETPLSGAVAERLVDQLAPLRAHPHVRVVIGCDAADNLQTLRGVDRSLRIGLDVEAPLDAAGPVLARRLGLIDDVSEYYLPKAFVLRALARGFNPIAVVHDHRPGALVDVWTLRADEPDVARALGTLLEAGVDQITTPTAVHMHGLVRREIDRPSRCSRR
jgi:glycerophosphoryl diester phosphodiesterase